MDGGRIIASSGISAKIGALLVEISDVYHLHKPSINDDDCSRIRKDFESMENTISFYSSHLSFESRRKVRKCLAVFRKVINDIERRGRIGSLRYAKLEQVSHETIDMLGHEWNSSF